MNIHYCRKCVIVDEVNADRLCAVCVQLEAERQKDKEIRDGNQG